MSEGERGGRPPIAPPGGGRSGSGTPPQSVAEALAQARTHGRAALAEALYASRALLDAAALAARGEPSAETRLLAPLTRLIERAAHELDATPSDASLLASLAEALDTEVARWEERARDDAEARAVLRAFLGLRELLWEFGVRRPERDKGDGGRGATVRSRKGSVRSAKGRRVQRVHVEG